MQKTFTLKVLLWVIPLLIIVASPVALARHDQQILDREITVDLKDVPLGVALNEIEIIAGVKFVYSPSQIDLGQTISIVAKQRKLREILNDLLIPKSIQYSVDKAREFILLKPQKAETERSSLQGKQGESDNTYQVVTGKVIDAITQQPIAGVNIVVKGTTSGTSTDSEGKYVINAEDSDILVFSFIGFKSFETAVNGRTVIDVMMEEDVAALTEVVVNAGYYEVTKDHATMNISKVTAKDIERQPVTTLLMALQSRVPGLDITPYNGAPGGAAQIQIRGHNSLRSGGSRALYVIDGVPVDATPIQSNATTGFFPFGFDPLSTLNPSNIESIEILKDAAATAIYGSRGANGVVLITTKGGKAGKTTVDINVSKGAGRLPQKVDLLNTKQYTAMRKEAFANDNALSALDGPFAWYYYPDLAAWDTTRYTDWQDVLLGETSSITDLQAGFSGGSSNTTFSLGGEFYKETTIYPGAFGFNRVNSNFNFIHTSPDRKLQVGFSLNYGATKSNLGSQGLLVSKALTLPPNAPKLYNEDGSLNWELYPIGTTSYNTWTNPLSNYENTHDSKTTNLISNIRLSYKIIPGLTIKSSFGYTELSQDEYLRNPISSYSPTLIGSVTGRATSGKNDRTSWITEPQINWIKDINDHYFDIVAGGTYQGANASFFSVTGSGYTSDVFLNSIRLAPTKEIQADNSSQYRYVALFIRLGYTWKDKYLLDLIARRDGSSRFGPDKQYGNFWAVGTGWIFSQENWVRNNLGFLSFGKIRSSYGVTGNDQTGDYLFLDLYSAASTTYQGTVSLTPNSLFNPDLAWEETKKLEIATELRFLNERIFLDVSRYVHRSSNQLVTYPLPATTGFAGISSNLDAEIENTGWEFLLGGQIIKQSNFTWNVSANLTIPKNKLVKFDKIEESTYANLYKVGKPLTVQRLFTWEGVNPETGVHEIADINQDGNIDNEDKSFTTRWLGRKYYGGVSNTLTYRNFDLSFHFQFSDLTTNGLGVTLPQNYPGVMVNQPVDVLKRWQGEGDVTNIPRFSQNPDNSLYDRVWSSDLQINNIRFIRLKTLSLTYRLPSKWTSKAHLEDAKVYLHGQNTFTLKDHNGFDPETGVNLPPLRIISIGIQVKI